MPLVALTLYRSSVNVSSPIPLHHRDPVPLLVTTLCLGCAWLSFLLRAWTRARIIRAFGWDDSAMMMAVVSLSSKMVERSPNECRYSSLFSQSASSSYMTLLVAGLLRSILTYLFKAYGYVLDLTSPYCQISSFHYEHPSPTWQHCSSSERKSVYGD